jgi:hypothetical protein
VPRAGRARPAERSSGPHSVSRRTTGRIILRYACTTAHPARINRVHPYRPGRGGCVPGGRRGQGRPGCPRPPGPQGQLRHLQSDRHDRGRRPQRCTGSPGSRFRPGRRPERSRFRRPGTPSRPRRPTHSTARISPRPAATATARYRWLWVAPHCSHGGSSCPSPVAGASCRRDAGRAEVAGSNGSRATGRHLQGCSGGEPVRDPQLPSPTGTARAGGVFGHAHKQFVLVVGKVNSFCAQGLSGYAKEGYVPDELTRSAVHPMGAGFHP